MKLNYKQTFLIGFGFFATSIAWSIYNSYVPLLLDNFIASSTLVGFIMSIDNIFGVVFQPAFGALSDTTRSRSGRRMPYIWLGIPLCAALFALVPSMSGMLRTLMATIIAFNFVMSTWRSQVVALMPDLTPAPLRSKANGIINLMGGIGSLIAFAVGGWLAGNAGENVPFYLTSVVMVAALVVLVFFVREPSSIELPQEGRQGATNSRPGNAGKICLGILLAAILVWFASYYAIDALLMLYAANRVSFYLTCAVLLAALAALVFFVRKLTSDKLRQERAHKEKEHFQLSRGEKRSLILLLAAIFFWFAGYNAIETFFTLYATNTLHAAGSAEPITKGAATMLLAFFSVTFIAAALPAGILGGRLGRRRTILLGLLGVTVLFIPMFFVTNLTVLRIMLLLGGAFWALVNINSLPMVVELAGKARIGTFTGYYYFASFSAAIVSPTLFGFIRDLTGNYALIFLYAAVAFALAIACIAFVRHGESAPQRSVGAIEAVGMADD